jgi:hypothetical protein
MSFISNKNKIQNIFQDTYKNQREIFKQQRLDFKNEINKISLKNQSSFTNKINIVSIDTTPTYYDLYKYSGISQSIGSSSPSPASAYKATLISGSIYEYDFIYPTIGFAVPAGATPESYTDGATPWTFQTSIAIIKSRINFPNIPDWGIDGTKIICYLVNEDGSPVTNLSVTLQEGGENIEEITILFSYFYRWIKLDVGYDFEFYAIYPMVANSQVSLIANLYIYNKRKAYAISSTKI